METRLTEKLLALFSLITLTRNILGNSLCTHECLSNLSCGPGHYLRLTRAIRLVLGRIFLFSSNTQEYYLPSQVNLS